LILETEHLSQFTTRTEMFTWQNTIIAARVYGRKHST